MFARIMGSTQSTHAGALKGRTHGILCKEFVFISGFLVVDKLLQKVDQASGALVRKERSISCH